MSARTWTLCGVRGILIVVVMAVAVVIDDDATEQLWKQARQNSSPKLANTLQGHIKSQHPEPLNNDDN